MPTLGCVMLDKALPRSGPRFLQSSNQDGNTSFWEFLGGSSSGEALWSPLQQTLPLCPPLSLLLGLRKLLEVAPPTPLGRRRRPELDALVLAATWCLKSELHHLL